MKKFLVAMVFGFMAVAAQAEASFDQIEGLIQQQNYSAAAAGLEVIIQNHPKSAKAFYAMAQAQAGLGNLEKAQKALNIATGLNPTLDFAPADSVTKLKQAITPQTAKIEAVEETHFWATFAYVALFAGFAVACYFLYSVYARKEEEEAKAAARAEREAQDIKRKQEWAAMVAKQEAERQEAIKAEEALKSHKNYHHERFDPANPDKLKSVAQFKKEQAEAARVLAEAEARRQRLRAEAAEEDARRARYTSSYSSTPSTTVVNNSSNDMLTGVLIGNMISGSHHDHTTVIEREVVRETPARSSRSSWDSDSSSSSNSRSSSWDDDSSSRSSSRSSSWDSDSSSSSSSSWSSSDSGSSSSWD